MIQTAVGYSLLFQSVFGLITIFRWWKRTDKLEKTVFLLNIVGAGFFGFAMLL